MSQATVHGILQSRCCAPPQVANNGVSGGGGHRRSRSWQQYQQQQQLAAMQQSDLHVEHSRGSESTLGGYATAHSEAPSGMSEGSPAPLGNVQQHSRNFSAQSLSGFSDPGTPQSAAAGRLDDLVNASSTDRGPPGFMQGSVQPASLSAAGNDNMQWSRLTEQPHARQNSDPGTVSLHGSPA